ncbi:MAG TPA: hypothetical protein VKN63_10070, partial [Afifellaceae bacterium]|nr:hypothetical protein [Afifellaceae bacterium]
MILHRISADQDRSRRRPLTASGSASLRREGRAVAAALRRHGGQRQSLTARLMGDPPPGRSALERRRAASSGTRTPHPDISQIIPSVSFAEPVVLMDPADPFDDQE